MPVNLGNPHEITIREFAAVINEMSGNSSGTCLDGERTGGDPERRQPNIQRAKRLLGWKPRVSLTDGLELTLAYFRERLAMAA